MNILNILALNSNRHIKINFDGGDLSSDTDLLLIKEFISKLGIEKLFGHSFKTNFSIELTYMYTFLVTNMDSSPEYLISFYCKRRRMENFKIRL